MTTTAAAVALGAVMTAPAQAAGDYGDRATYSSVKLTHNDSTYSIRVTGTHTTQPVGTVHDKNIKLGGNCELNLMVHNNTVGKGDITQHKIDCGKTNKAFDVSFRPTKVFRCGHDISVGIGIYRDYEVTTGNHGTEHDLTGGMLRAKFLKLPC